MWRSRPVQLLLLTAVPALTVIGVCRLWVFHAQGATLTARVFLRESPANDLEPQVLDLRYCPQSWQGCIGLLDDPHKTMIASDGSLCYDYHEGAYFGDYDTRITATIEGAAKGAVRQSLWGPRVPIVITEQQSGDIRLRQEAWAGAPRLARVEDWSRRRVDYLWLTVSSSGRQAQDAGLVVTVQSRNEYEAAMSNSILRDKNDPNTVFCRMSPPCARVHVEDAPKGHALQLIYEGGVDQETGFQVLLTFYRGPDAFAQTPVGEAGEERDLAVQYWERLDLPYDRIVVPDKQIQALLDSSIRNIYQSRELRDGRPAFQVGPTCYRSTWAADGAFLLEAVTYLGRASEARQGLELQLEGEGGPDGVKFSKKAGLRLWMIHRHAQLTGDRAWLEQMWPAIRAEVDRIIAYRALTRGDPGQANYGLMPPGFGDGGLAGLHREYTNVYWTLIGLKSAVEMAACLGKEEWSRWRSEYKDYWQTFDRARHRDKLTDPGGHVYIPVTMHGESPQLPQRGAWTFLHAVYPGDLFAANDPLMRSTMAMLDAHQEEGLILGTGWLDDGLWTYAGSFYAHAHLWLGHGAKAAATLYAFANHACPLLCWREEQKPAGAGPYVGDMPHNWASAECIRLVRHLIVLERGDVLHLLPGLPDTWTRPGAQVRLVEVPTTFGPMSLSLTMAADGESASIVLDPPIRERIDGVVLHLEPFTRLVRSVTCEGKPLRGGRIRMPPNAQLHIDVEFKP
jgi:hypothetical protein